MMGKGSLRSRAGVGLAELLVVVSLLGLIAYAVGVLIRTGVDYYYYSIDTLEVQKRALFAVSRLSNELTHSAIESVRVFNTAPFGTDLDQGVVFAVGRGPNNEMMRDLSGRILWTKLVCYYITDVEGVPMLMRKEETLPPPYPSADPPDPLVLGKTASYFKGNASLSPQQIARGVSRLRSEILTDALEASFTAEVRGGRNWFETDIQTKIIPRN
jgi:hypothetical protein